MNSAIGNAVYVLGAGNQARETLTYYKDLNRLIDVKAFIVQNLRKQAFIDDKEVLDASIIGTLDPNALFISAMGSPLRKSWLEQLEEQGVTFDRVIHPAAYLGTSVEIRADCTIGPHSVLTRDISVGKHTLINVSCSISHDCKIGELVTICPGVNIGGNVKVGDCSWIGIGATVSHGVSIGKGSCIGAGSVVVDDIPDNFLAVGVPAKPIRAMGKLDWQRIV